MKASDSDDYVPVQSCSTPTEAYLIRGVLESAGLTAVTTDSHLLQAYDWLTPAAGGVRVLVPASEVAAAAEALRDYRAGDLALADPDAPPAPAFEKLAAPIFSPDIAALLSFVLVNPAFGAGVHLLNARTLQPRGASLAAWGWFLGLCAASLGTIAMVALGPAKAPVNPAFAAFGTSLLTAIWFLGYAQAHGKAVLQRFGSAYPRRALAPLAFGVIALQFALAAALFELLG